MYSFLFGGQRNKICVNKAIPNTLSIMEVEQEVQKGIG